jgi:hypothetical protein
VIRALLLAAGCAPPREPPAGPGWDEVRPILARCATCHDGRGLAAPLLTPADWRTFAAPAAEAVSTGAMPPWPAAEVDVAYANDGRLPDADRDTLLAWLDAGAPAPPGAAPLAPVPEPGLDRVDAVLAMDAPYTPVADEETRCFVLDRAALADPYLTGVQVVPGDPAIAHHLLVSAVVASSAATAPSTLDAADPAPGWACPEWLSGLRVDGLGGWLPGRSPTALPPGVGLALDPAAEVVLQAHYLALADGADRTEVRLRTEPAVDRRAAELRLAHRAWVAPAVAVPARSTKTWRFATTVAREVPATGLAGDDGLEILAVIPHLHTHGARIAVSAVVDGEPLTLVDIPAWDYDWQLTYTLAAPLRVRPADELRLVCTFVNDGDVDVTFGEQVTDEMCVARLLVAEPAVTPAR